MQTSNCNYIIVNFINKENVERKCSNISLSTIQAKQKLKSTLLSYILTSDDIGKCLLDEIPPN
jgi:hypothetical protein